MKNYSVFVRENTKTGALEDVILLESGFNIYAAIFSLFWLLGHGLWSVALSASLLIGLTFSVTPILRFSILSVSSLALGFFANYLLVRSLDHKGNYYFIGMASGADREEARSKFLEEINREFRDRNQVIY
ncbi:MAG: hypothetical protein LBB24_03520 [Rickettsiales bacterium]|jgi:hypothetical protein|nr:hypothetical protein [Rickettsiales bacterium]